MFVDITIEEAGTFDIYEAVEYDKFIESIVVLNAIQRGLGDIVVVDANLYVWCEGNINLI